MSTSGRTALAIAGVSVALAVSLTVALPPLAAIAPETDRGLATWSIVGPLLAGLACVLLLHRRLRIIRRGDLGPEHLGDLPGQMLLLFLVIGFASVPLGQALSPWPALAGRPAMLLLGAPALVLAHALALRFVVQVPLVAEMERLLAGKGAASQPGGSRSLPGVLSLRRSMAIAALAASAASLGLMAAHTESRARREHEVISTGHLKDLVTVVSAQLHGMSEEALARFLAGYPASSAGAPLLTDLEGHVLMPPSAAPAGARLSVLGETCRFGDAVHRCAASVVGGRRLVVLLPTATSALGPLEKLRLDLVLLGLALLAIASLLGWAVGRDTSQDFRAMAEQLEALASQEEPDLGRPIAVTSIDEVGDLTAALGSLRTHLAGELGGYRESLRKAQEADRLRNRFFSDVSHALRTPLTTIYGSAQLLAEGLLGELPASQRQDLRIIHGSAQHLLALIKDVIDMSVIESGHLALNLEKVDAVELCREALRAHEAQARQRGEETGKPLRLSFDAEPELPHLVVDPLRLRQIIQNLVANAINHTEAGSVAVTLARRGDSALALTVRDTGQGISAADLPHIFERYRRGQVGSQRPGSGLGLGITKQLVGLHGGEVTVTSKVSQGSTFTVVLPLRGPGAPVKGAVT